MIVHGCPNCAPGMPCEKHPAALAEIASVRPQRQEEKDDHARGVSHPSADRLDLPRRTDCPSELLELVHARMQSYGYTPDVLRTSEFYADWIDLAIVAYEAGEEGWIQIATKNAADGLARQAQLEQQVVQVAAQRDKLRAALVGLVGVDGDELEQLEAAMRLLPAPAEDKARTIDAIHALIATEAK